MLIHCVPFVILAKLLVIDVVGSPLGGMGVRVWRLARAFIGAFIYVIPKHGFSSPTKFHEMHTFTHVNNSELVTGTLVFNSASVSKGFVVSCVGAIPCAYMIIIAPRTVFLFHRRARYPKRVTVHTLPLQVTCRWVGVVVVL